MARRPSAPRSRPGSDRERPRPAEAESVSRSVVEKRTPAGKRAPAGTLSADTPAEPADQRSRVVQAADRFRTAVAGRPWQRHRRALLLSALVAVLLIGGTVAALLLLPALQVSQVRIAGTDYVETAPIEESIAPTMGQPLLTIRAGSLEERIEEIPGVATAEVSRSWPDTVEVTVTEREPLAVLTGQDGSTTVLDAEGVELPAAAAEGRTLMPMEVGASSRDPQAATETMLEVLAALPPQMREKVESVTATSRSDVSLRIQVEGVGTKEVIWGDAADGELKADVVETLLDQRGTVIDVTSPVAPVTR